MPGFSFPVVDYNNTNTASPSSLPSPSSQATRFFIADHLGTAVMELSSGGWPVYQGQFAPFGQELQPNGFLLPTDAADGSSSHYKFTGKERDAESGLDYFGARYYASNQGRWMSPDWAANPQAVPYSSLPNPQSLNLYAYVGNNPLDKIDSDGHVESGFEALKPGANEFASDTWGTYQGTGGSHSQGFLDAQAAGQATPQPAQQNNAPHPYVAPTGPGTEIGNILDPAHPSNPGPIGTGECVAACRHYEQGLPDHTQWTQGVPVVITVNGKLTINPAVKPGTAIAAGWDASGHYPGPEASHKNSGVFLGPGLIGPAGSIRILDQWPGSPGPRPRDMSPTGGYGTWDVSNHSTAYYVIMAK